MEDYFTKMCCVNVLLNVLLVMGHLGHNVFGICIGTVYMRFFIESALEGKLL